MPCITGSGSWWCNGVEDIILTLLEEWESHMHVPPSNLPKSPYLHLEEQGSSEGTRGSMHY